MLHVLSYHMFGLDFNHTQTPANTFPNVQLIIFFEVL